MGGVKIMEGNLAKLEETDILLPGRSDEKKKGGGEGVKTYPTQG